MREVALVRPPALGAKDEGPGLPRPVDGPRKLTLAYLLYCFSMAFMNASRSFSDMLPMSLTDLP